MSFAIRPRRFPVFLIAAVAIIGMVAGVLSAQDMAAPAVYPVIVGSSGPANMDLTAFFPSYVQVHQGDMIVYNFAGFHNARFGTDVLPLVVMGEVDGAPGPIINPEVAFGTSMDPTAPQVFDGTAPVNSGLPDPAAPMPMMVVMNAEPGVYSVFCDVHPGMVQAVEVVAADVVIPSPDEVSAQAGQELGALIGVGLADFAAEFASPQETTDTGVLVRLGQRGGSRAESQLFFPHLSVISAGQTVTWEVPADHAGGHVVGNVPRLGEDVVVIPSEAGPPTLVPGAAISPAGPASGETFSGGVEFQSGLLEPGHSYTLTFAEPGVYPTYCSIHPGMVGAVVVNP